MCSINTPTATDNVINTAISNTVSSPSASYFSLQYEARTVKDACNGNAEYISSSITACAGMHFLCSCSHYAGFNPD